MKTRFIIALIIILVGLTLWGIRALASSSVGPNSPYAATNDSSVGTYAWNNPTNVEVSDGQYASVSTGGNSFTYYLYATGFGFSIPTGATIDGVVAQVQKVTLAGAGSTVDNSVKLIKGGTISGTDKADTTTPWPYTEAYVSYGGSSDLWGLSLTPSDVSASNFGLAFSAEGGYQDINGYPAIDHIELTVYYTTASGTHASVTQTSGKWVITGGKTIIQ